jgi:hypothetical protein
MGRVGVTQESNEEQAQPSILALQRGKRLNALVGIILAGRGDRCSLPYLGPGRPNAFSQSLELFARDFEDLGLGRRVAHLDRWREIAVPRR